jgi:hypothetical protein
VLQNEVTYRGAKPDVANLASRRSVHYCFWQIANFNWQIANFSVLLKIIAYSRPAPRLTAPNYSLCMPCNNLANCQRSHSGVGVSPLAI